MSVLVVFKEVASLAARVVVSDNVPFVAVLTTCDTTRRVTFVLKVLTCAAIVFMHYS